VGEGREWLRYHALFQEFLQTHPAKESPQEYERILHQLAQYHKL
jgi:ATP/maltotriose-dependent transcriptional regulator MalT